MSDLPVNDNPPRTAARAAARRAEELSARQEFLHSTDHASGYDNDAALGNVERARVRADVARERSAVAHDAAARLHDEVADRFEDWASAHPDDQQEYLDRASSHHQAAATDRLLAAADRIPPAGAVTTEILENPPSGQR